MKNIVILLSLVCLSGSPVWAQEKPAEAKPAPKKVKTMIDYKEQLGLTDEQVNQVKEILTSFKTTVGTERQSLVNQEKEFKGLLQSNAPLADIKSKLREISDTRFRLRYADVLTSRRVSETLSAEQMQKWKSIQQQVRAKK